MLRIGINVSNYIGYYLFNNLNSLYPLLKKDGLILPYIATLLANFFILILPFLNFPSIRFIKIADKNPIDNPPPLYNDKGYPTRLLKYFVMVCTDKYFLTFLIYFLNTLKDKYNWCHDITFIRNISEGAGLNILFHINVLLRNIRSQI